MWGVDIIKPILPKTSNSYHFILVAIDYLSKWVEASSYTNVIKGVILQFIKKDIIAQYKMPETMITNNGINLNNKLIVDLCQ